MIQNPFETGHIRNYVLLYASVVVIMILFFFASTLFNTMEKVDKKVFNTKVPEKQIVEASHEKRFKLMKSSY